MRALFINLDRTHERRHWMEDQASALGFALERLPAVDGATLTAPAGGRVSSGALACFHSHRKAWEIAAAGSDPYCAIFEDDAHLSPDLPRFLSDTSWIPADADIVHLGRSREHCVVLNDVRTALDRAMYRTVTENSGTEGYIISRSCAGRLLAAFLHIEEEFDIVLFNDNAFALTIYKLVPSLCIQDQFVGTPRFGGQIERRALPRKRNGKLLRETRRMATKLKHATTRLLGLRQPIRIRVDFR